MKKIFLLIVFLFSFIIGSAQSELWGMTVNGGKHDVGTIFKTDGSGNNHVVDHDLFQVEGSEPLFSFMNEASDGMLYGMIQKGGVNSSGLIFKYNPITFSYTKVFDFDNNLSLNTGYEPTSGLIQATDGKLYGMVGKGGANNLGVIFQFDPVTLTFVKKFDFTGAATGSNPAGSLMQATDGMLYGLTNYGGTNDKGVLFQFDPVTSAFTKKVDFGGVNGDQPSLGLIQASDGMLYGTANAGGVNNLGVLFQYDPVTSVFTKKIDFSGALTGSLPKGMLVQASDGNIYGLTNFGGINDKGVIFQYDPVNSSINKKYDFQVGATGQYPYGRLTEAPDGKLYGLTISGGTYTMGVVFQFDPVTSVYTKKIDFDGTNKGQYPYGSLMCASNGKLYGLTQVGGFDNKGVMFEYDPATSGFVKRHDMLGAVDGKRTSGSLVYATDGKFYGTTQSGGAYNCGVIFQYDPMTHNYVKKFDFDGVNTGKAPTGSLIQASDGKLYGMATQGGLNSKGVLFQFDPVSSSFVNKINFSGVSNGQAPYGSLTEATDGKLYGMTLGGGTYSIGVIFQYDPSSSILVKKFDFSGAANGKYPYGSLVQAGDGNLYGFTTDGGAANAGVLFQYNPITSVTTKKIDLSLSGGSKPYGALTEAIDGNLYGMTQQGGAFSYGVIFQYNPSTSQYTKKMDFNGSVNGAWPQGSFLSASDGNLYGMTTIGGNNNAGVLFQYNVTNSVYTKKLDFDGLNGKTPGFSNLIELVNVPTGIKNAESNLLDKIYPNPAHDMIHIHSSDELKRIDLQNVSGQVLLSKLTEGKDESVDLLTIMNGIYFVKIYFSNGGSKIEKLIIIR